MALKILVLSVSAGAGHVRAAEAICSAARAAQPDVRATQLDLLTLVPREFRKLYAEQYIKLVEKLPQLWSWLYAKSDRPSRDSMPGKLKRAIESQHPQARRRNRAPEAADYLLEAGAAVKAIDGATLEFKLARLLAEPRRLAAMSAAAHRIATPDAARAVLQLICAQP